MVVVRIRKSLWEEAETVARVQLACFILALFGAWGPFVSSRAQAADLNGHWEGSWNSFCTRHHGPLKADFCRINASQYEVRFKGRIFAIVPFRYSAVLNVVSEEGGVTYLEGSHYLGKLAGGTFSYRATVQGDRFVATYSCSKDRGQFVFCRTCY